MNLDRFVREIELQGVHALPANLLRVSCRAVTVLDWLLWLITRCGCEARDSHVHSRGGVLVITLICGLGLVMLCVWV